MLNRRKIENIIILSLSIMIVTVLFINIIPNLWIGSDAERLMTTIMITSSLLSLLWVIIMIVINYKKSVVNINYFLYNNCKDVDRITKNEVISLVKRDINDRKITNVKLRTLLIRTIKRNITLSSYKERESLFDDLSPIIKSSNNNLINECNNILMHFIINCISRNK